MNDLLTTVCFPSIVYTIDKPEFIEKCKIACDKSINEITSKIDNIYSVKMSTTLLDKSEISNFANFVVNVGWDILKNQGYDLNGLETFFTEMWCQEHHKTGNMDQHVHGFGDQIVGFYFMDCPQDSPLVIFHDPKAAKVQIGLKETEPTEITASSAMVNFEPKPGLLIFSNSWLPHSTTRHRGDKPIRFIHFNIAVRAKQISHDVEIV